MPKQSLLIIVSILFILLAVYFKLIIGHKTFLEFDDAGVISLHHTMYEDRNINIKITDSIKFDFLISGKYLAEKSLSNPLLFASYIGYNWSYPPGQFLFTSLLINENDSFTIKIYKGRFISGLFSLISIFLLFLICRKIKINNILTLLVMVWFMFVINQNLYSYHMGPYALHSAAWLLMYYLYFSFKDNPIKIIKFLPIASISFYFSYLNIFPIASIGLLFLIENRKSLFFLVKDGLIYIITSFILLIPVLVFIKPGLADSGSLSNAFNLLDLFKSVRSSISISSSDILNSILLLILIFLFVYFLLIKFSNKNNEKYESKNIFILFLPILIWISLSIFEFIVLEESRHVLVWSAPLILIFAILVNYFLDLKYLIRFKQFIISVFICFLFIQGSYSNYNVFKKKIDVVNYNLLDQISDHYVLVYAGSIAPLLYLKSKGSNRVFYIDNNSFKRSDILDKIFSDCSKRIYLVSQEVELKEYINNNTQKYNLSNYRYEALDKIETFEYMTYNNKFSITTPNNFYAYEMFRDNCNIYFENEE